METSLLCRYCWSAIKTYILDQVFSVCYYASCGVSLTQQVISIKYALFGKNMRGAQPLLAAVEFIIT